MMIGKVEWFDNEKGEGMVRDVKTDISYYFHYSAIESEDAWKRLNKNDMVEFSLYSNLYMDQVDKIKKNK